jgi:hypothetical protein
LEENFTDQTINDAPIFGEDHEKVLKCITVRGLRAAEIRDKSKKMAITKPFLRVMKDLIEWGYIQKVLDKNGKSIYKKTR